MYVCMYGVIGCLWVCTDKYSSVFTDRKCILNTPPPRRGVSPAWGYVLRSFPGLEYAHYLYLALFNCLLLKKGPSPICNIHTYLLKFYLKVAFFYCSYTIIQRRLFL